MPLSQLNDGEGSILCSQTRIRLQNYRLDGNKLKLSAVLALSFYVELQASSGRRTKELRAPQKQRRKLSLGFPPSLPRALQRLHVMQEQLLRTLPPRVAQGRGSGSQWVMQYRRLPFCLLDNQLRAQQINLQS